MLCPQTLSKRSNSKRSLCPQTLHYHESGVSDFVGVHAQHTTGRIASGGHSPVAAKHNDPLGKPAVFTRPLARQNDIA